MNTTDFTEATQNAAVGSTRLYFAWLDYTLFGLMLLISTLIGAYFGFWVKKENTTEEYLQGGRKMGLLPVSMSLTVSVLSGVMLIGSPTEIYLYGTLYWLICIAMICIAPITYYIYLPVFYELKVVSAYEYLQLRFNPSVRRMASGIYTIYQISIIPVVLYVPALTFSQVSGVNVHVVAPVIGLLCVFYSIVGGMKAVVWTDLLQGMVMFLASFAVILLGLIRLGGFENVWTRSREGGRLQFFVWDFSPFVRHTTWNLVFGKLLQYIGWYTVNQVMVQRYLSLPTFSTAGKSIILSQAGMVILTSMSCFMGLLVYTLYADCDPLKAGVVNKPDQVVSLYVMEVSSSIPGLPGLYLSGILSAALSTISSSLNGLGAIIYHDFTLPIVRRWGDVNEKTATNIIKMIIFFIGLLAVLLVYVIEHLGNVMQVTNSLMGATNGALVGLFTFGMFFPRGNAKGALAGSVLSVAFMSWVVFGAQHAIASGSLRFPRLNTSTEGCNLNYTLPTKPTPIMNNEDVFFLYRISYINYTALGAFIMLVVSTVVSVLTKPPGIDKLNPVLFTPCVRKYVEKRRNLYCRETQDGQELQKMFPKEK